MVGHSELSKLELRPGDVSLGVEQLRLTPLFAQASEATLRRLGGPRGKGAVALRRYRAGDVVCRQGEPGWTAFYILRDADLRRLGVAAFGNAPADPEISGAPSIAIDKLLLSQGEGNRVKAVVSITPASRLRSLLPERSLLRRVQDRLVRSKRRPKKTIPVDASADVVISDEGPPVGYLREGELFGEMSCFNHTPRSATVRTIEECYLLELMRNVLEDALDNEAFRDALNQVYRRRALESHLASMPIFENASPGALDAIRKRAKLVSYDAGTTIYHEGDPADAMYFIRHGTVKIFRGESDGRVLGYRSRGKWIGVGSMLAGDKRRASAMAHEIGSKDDRPRSAAAGRVELVRIDRALFEEVADEFPELHETAAQLAEQHSIRSSQDRHTMGVENLAGSLGLLQGEKLMLIDLDRCTRCDDCVRACADTHGGVAHLTRSGPRFGPYLIPDTCRQCLDPVCLVGCPVGSIHRGTDGEIVIENWCIGCGLCAEQCPYDAIRIGEGALRKAQVCDQCTSLGSGPPMCVYACPHDAAHRVDGHSFFADWVRRS